MSYRDAHVLITGGLGFIGSNLAIELVRLGAHVTVIDNLMPEGGGCIHNVADVAGALTVHVADVSDKGTFDVAVSGKDFLFNLAAQTSHLGSMRDPLADLEVNTAAQLRMLESCRNVNPDIKVVYASTRQLYGKPQYLPVDEAHPIRPVDVNGVSKLAGEHFHLLYNDVYGIRATVLRLTNTYGPRMRIRDARQTFIGLWIRRLLDGHTIQVFGDGKQRRDFIYVDDCVQAILVAGGSEATNGKVFNLAGNEVIGLSELAGMVTALRAGSVAELVPFPPERKAIDIGDYYGDSTLFARTVGWEPHVSLRDGLQKTIEYYERCGSLYLQP